MQVISNDEQPGLLEQTYEKNYSYLEVRAKHHLLAILETLSNRDAFEIFKLALSGIDATTDVLDEYHFSRKRYYVRLRKLVELGLVRKESKRYTHTPLGKRVYETLVKSLEEAISCENVQA